MANQKFAVGGVHEVVVGVPSLLESAQYFERFGYSIEQTGVLAAAQAADLYGVNSDLRSALLRHGQHSYGYIRLIEWNELIGDGLGLHPMRALGTRWSAQHTRSIMTLRQHAYMAAEAGLPIRDIEPTFIDLSKALPGRYDPITARPFLDPAVHTLEYTMLQLLYRQVFFQKFNYGGPTKSGYADHSLFQTTPILHVALMCQSDDPSVLDFYDRVLGTKRSVDEHAPYKDTQASRKVFDLAEGEDHWHVDFEDPRSVNKSKQDISAGRLKCFRFGSTSNIPNQSMNSRPGMLGYCLYTWKISDLNAFKRVAMDGGVTDCSDTVSDEFGRLAFNCTTPDGYRWGFIQA